MAGWLLYRIAGRLAELHPVWSPWLKPLVWTYVLMVFVTFMASPLFQLLLLLHPEGRRALSPRERTATVAGSACLAVGALGIASYPITGHAIGLLAAFQAALICAPLYSAVEEADRRRRTVLVIAVLCYAAFAALVLVLIWREWQPSVKLWLYGFYSWLALLFLPAFLKRVAR
ncbi:MAG: hypothetical protein H0W83_06850 [Planctomycetes bacterium]|nr:hypothetical protein [Planctomycetota bacterium]